MAITSACDAQVLNSEQQRIDLYVEVMKSAFQEGNGGDDFIAIKLDTLEGLSSEGKDSVLESFKKLSSNIYDFEDIKHDESKFEIDEGRLLKTINGSILSIELEDYKDYRAKITGVSSYGHSSYVSIEYYATLANENWDLREFSISKLDTPALEYVPYL